MFVLIRRKDLKVLQRVTLFKNCKINEIRDRQQQTENALKK